VKEVDKIIRSQTMYIMKVELDLLANQTRLKKILKREKIKAGDFKILTKNFWNYTKSSIKSL
jgi:hypothetical protein